MSAAVAIPFQETLQRELARSGTAWQVFGDDDEALSWAQQQVDALSPGEAALTWATALVAETGSLVLCGADGQPRRDSLLVHRHVVLVHARDIYADLASYFESLPKERLHQELGSHLTLITGASRTADIEKVLVMPAHGPAEVMVGIVSDS